MILDDEHLNLKYYWKGQKLLSAKIMQIWWIDLNDDRDKLGVSYELPFRNRIRICSYCTYFFIQERWWGRHTIFLISSFLHERWHCNLAKFWQSIGIDKSGLLFSSIFFLFFFFLVMIFPLQGPAIISNKLGLSWAKIELVLSYSRVNFRLNLKFSCGVVRMLKWKLIVAKISNKLYLQLQLW